MRSQLSILVSVSHIAACQLFAGGIPEPFLPQGVTFGMTCDAVQAAHPNVFKPEIPILPFRVARAQLATGEKHEHASVAVLMEANVKASPVAIHTYYFSAQKLAAVMYASAHSIPPQDGAPPFQSLRDALDRHFERQADENVLSLSSEELDPETRRVESWRDAGNGNVILFDVESHALRCVIYDPRIFSKSDFYLEEGDLELFAPTIQAAKKAWGGHKPELEQLEKRRQEEINRIGTAAQKALPDHEPPAAAQAECVSEQAPVTEDEPTGNIPEDKVKASLPSYPLVYVGIFSALCAGAVLWLIRKKE